METLILLLVAAGVVGGTVWVTFSSPNGRQKKESAASIAARERLQRQEAEDASAHRATQLAAQLISESRTAANVFSWMPVRLETAAQSYARAGETFRDGAFSPFWSAIEVAYGALAAYLADAGKIAASAYNHQRIVRELAEHGGVDPEIARFPVALDMARVGQQHKELLSRLDAIVYEAQKQPTFATIWEQRRTTAAVIDGFRNLEDAVNSMGARVSASLENLGTQLQGSNDVVSASVSRHATAIVSANADQLAELRAIRAETAQVREHLYYPELTRWLG